MSDLKRQTLSGAGWVSAGQVAQILVRFGVVIVLARLLAPADFGLVALALTILGICQVIAPVGTPAALVQLRDVGTSDVKAAFTVSMLTATLLAPGAVLVGYLAEDALRTPGLGLAMLLLAPAIHLDAVGKIASRMLEARMQFQPTAVAAFLAYVVGYGGIGVGCAYTGFGWKALCLAETASAAILALWLVYVGRPPLGITFHAPTWRRLVRFGSTLTFANLVYWASSNVPQIVIGSWMSSTAVGLFTRASTLSARFGSLVERLTSTVLYAAFCQRNDDLATLGRALSASASLILLVVFPSSAVISALGEPIVLSLFGEQWGNAVGTFQILAFSIPFLMLQRVALTMGHSLGGPAFAVRANMVALVVAAGGSIIGVRYGLEGVALAVLAAIGISACVAVSMVSTALQLPTAPFLVSLLKGGTLTGGAYALCVTAERLLQRTYGSIGTLPQLAIVAPIAAATLMGLWFFGQRQLFSQPAQALIAQGLKRLGDRLRYSTAG